MIDTLNPVYHDLATIFFHIKTQKQTAPQVHSSNTK
jgi:hypothetical protein